MSTPSLIKGDLRLGFGCSGAWSKPWFSARKAEQLVRAAIDLGITHIDTAGFYADAEVRLGNALNAIPKNKVTISTKTGTVRHKHSGTTKDFSAATIEKDVIASLRRLNVEKVDVLYLHGPNSAQMQEAAPTLVRLKQKGLIEFSGVCGEGRYLDEAAQAPFIDVIMGAYNFLRPEHEATFKTAKSHGKKVVAIAPLAQGLYRKGLFFPKSLSDGWHLARAIIKNPDELKRARAAASALSEPGWTPAGLALGYVLANKDIDAAITTTTKMDHLAASVAAARQSISPASLKRLRSVATGT